MTAARRRLIDGRRRRSAEAKAVEDLLVLAGGDAARDPVPVPDNRLSLMFVCGHPAIEQRMRAPLILQTLLGLDASTIASAASAAGRLQSGRSRQALGVCAGMRNGARPGSPTS